MRLRQLIENLNRTGQGKAAVVGWGRGMGHKGHMYLASSVITQANEEGADPYFVVSRTVGKDDPITPEEKIQIYKKVFPKHGHIFHTATDEMPDLTRVLAQLDHHGYTDVTVVVGADQVKGLSYVKQYNGVPDKAGKIPFSFNSLNVISRQETNDPSREEEGPRATPMRSVLTDPNASDEQKFQTWRDAMSPEISDDEVRDLMHKAHTRMQDFNKPKVRAKKAVTEMDKSQTPPGRDSSHRSGPDREAKPITVKKATKDAGNMLNRAVKDSHKKKGMAEATGDERFDTMMGQIQREPTIPDAQMPPTDVKDLYQWAVKHHKPYHKIFAKWANREGYKSVAPALQKAGNLDSDALDYWTPDVWKLWFGPDSKMPHHWSKERVPDELRDYLETVFDAYENIWQDWPTEYRQIGDRGMAEGIKGANQVARALKNKAILPEGRKSHGTYVGLDKDVDAALPGVWVQRQLRNTDPYMQYRYGVAIAAARADAAGHVNFEQESPWAENLTIVGFTPQDAEVVKMADKLMGVKATRIANDASEEPKDTSSQSPVAKPKRNQYGV